MSARMFSHGTNQRCFERIALVDSMPPPRMRLAQVSGRGYCLRRPNDYLGLNAFHADSSAALVQDGADRRR